MNTCLSFTFIQLTRRMFFAVQWASDALLKLTKNKIQKCILEYRNVECQTTCVQLRGF